MNNINNSKKPNIIVADFDRTLTYLYRNNNLLIDLADKMIAFYSERIKIPQKYMENKIDGYFVWHELHDIVSEQMSEELAKQINQEADDLVADFELQIIKKIGLFDGVVKSIKNLSDLGIRLGIVSSNATVTVKFALQEAGILDKFEYVEGRPYPFNPKLLKPNPYPIKKALCTMNVSENTFWYVGDDIIDMKAAKAAFATAVGVCTGRYSNEELSEAGADLIFDSFNDIYNYIIA